MHVVGLKGSPRKKGVTNFLLATFLDLLEKKGAHIDVVDACQGEIHPCREYTVCEKTGFCPISDDMEKEIYGLLRRADIVVAASPVFFFGISAQLKALVDRCQVFWARKYRLKLKDPGAPTRRGFLLSAGGSKAPRLFDGVHLTAKYFFDAIDAEYAGALTYPEMEKRKEMMAHPTVLAELQQAADDLFAPFENRPCILFAGREGACRSVAAAALAKFKAGHRFEVVSGGTDPGQEVDKNMVRVMKKRGIDTAFQRPASVEAVAGLLSPDIVVTMDRSVSLTAFPSAKQACWDLDQPGELEEGTLNAMCNTIEAKVDALIL
ncbi:MAG: NAD(P)H-dependent oxidoreductase [Desulfobacteraceae bacterium]